MADPWVDRIPLNPKIEIETTVRGARGGDGSLDSMSDTGGMNAETFSPPATGSTRKAPANPPSTWSSGPDNND